MSVHFYNFKIGHKNLPKNSEFVVNEIHKVGMSRNPPIKFGPNLTSFFYIIG